MLGCRRMRVGRIFVNEGGVCVRLTLLKGVSPDTTLCAVYVENLWWFDWGV